jgi:hypothetical protein
MKSLKVLLATVAIMSSPYVLKAQDKQILSPQAQEFAVKFKAIIDDCQDLNMDAAEERFLMISGELSLKDAVEGIRSQRGYVLTKSRAHKYAGKQTCFELGNVVSNFLPLLENGIQKGKGQNLVIDFMNELESASNL